MGNKIVIIKNIAMIACLVGSGILLSSSSCGNDDYLMCVSKAAYQYGPRGRVYVADCLQDVYTSCGTNFVETKTYNSKKSCEMDRDYYAQNGPNAGDPNGSGGSRPAICDGGYVDPQGGNIQTNVFCEMAYHYICTAGLSLSSKEVKENCDIFKTYQGMGPGLENCKYCQ